MPIRDINSIINSNHANYTPSTLPFPSPNRQPTFPSNALPAKKSTYEDEDDEFKSSDSENDAEDGTRDWRHTSPPIIIPLSLCPEGSHNNNHNYYYDKNRTGGGESPSLSGNPLVIRAMKKLMQLQEQEDIQRFICRIATSQRKPKKGHSNSDCCFANNNNNNKYKRSKSNNSTNNNPSRNKTCYGPFLSCSVKHGKSNDFEELPDFYVDPNLMKNVFFYAPDWLQRPPNNSRTSRGQSNKTSAEWTKCRGCPNTSIFLLDPDLWISDYRYQVTYGRIPALDKKRLKEKLEQWIPSEDYKERQSWLRNRMASLSKFQANHRKMNLRHQIQASGFIDKEVSRRPSNNDHGPMYGPSALAALSGYNSFRKNSNLYGQKHGREAAAMHLPQEGPQPIMGNYYNYGTLLPLDSKDHQEASLYTGDDVPWPSDNQRYYDDDTDPRIIELLGQTPFLTPAGKIENKVPIQSSKTLETAGPTASSKNPASSRYRSNSGKAQAISINTVVLKKPVEYTIGSGRVQPKKLLNHESFNTTKQEQQQQTPILTNPKEKAVEIVKDGKGDSINKVKSKNNNLNKLSSTKGKAVQKTSPRTIPVSNKKKSSGESNLRKVPVKQIPKFDQNKTSSSKISTSTNNMSLKISEQPATTTTSSSSSSFEKMIPPTTPKILYVKKRISKPKIKRRFKQTISTVKLGIPKSKDSKVCFDDD